MNEPQSVAAEKIALVLLAGNDPNGCSLVNPSDLIPVSYGDSATWPPASSTTILDSFSVLKGYALLWTYLTLYTTLADESSQAIQFGFNFAALAQIQFRSLAATTSNFSNLTGQVQSQAIFNKPLLVAFDTDTRPQVVLYPNSSTQTANSVAVFAEAQGFLIPAALFSLYRQHASRIS